MGHPIRTTARQFRRPGSFLDTSSDSRLYNWYLLWHYNGTGESVIRTSQELLNTLPNKLDEFGFNITKFCNYVTKTIKTLLDTGNTDKQAPLKLYEALIMSHNNSFNSEIQAYKAIIAAKSKALEFSKLATMAKPSTIPKRVGPNGTQPANLHLQEAFC
eukprot:7147923-Ditylum_brightwellii.AAC.2